MFTYRFHEGHVVTIQQVRATRYLRYCQVGCAKSGSNFWRIKILAWKLAKITLKEKFSCILYIQIFGVYTTPSLSRDI